MLVYREPRDTDKLTDAEAISAHYKLAMVAAALLIVFFVAGA